MRLPGRYKALKAKPQERYRDETSPERGCGVETGEGVRNAEAGRWQVWDTCVRVERPGSRDRKVLREPNPRLLMRCRGGKPRRVQPGAT